MPPGSCVASLDPPQLGDEAAGLLQALLCQLGAKKRVRYEMLGGGRSEAHVLKLTIPSAKGATSAVVAKIGVRAEIQTELDRFRAFVNHRLDDHFRPELLAFASGTNMAALAYSYIGLPTCRPETLTQRLQAGSADSIDFILKNLFQHLFSRWYSKDISGQGPDIAARYRSHYFSGSSAIEMNERALRRRAARFFGADFDVDQYVCNGCVFPNPLSFLFASIRPRDYTCCIVHGDLNSDNVLFDRDGSAKVIDFAKTGEGHIAEDYVALESSVRINYPFDMGNAEIFECERQIASGMLAAYAPRYARAILGIRQALTQKIMQPREILNYHFAVAAIGLRLMQADDLNEVAHARICASIMWAIHALKDGQANSPGH